MSGAGYPDGGVPLGYAQYAISTATKLEHGLGTSSVDIPAGASRMQIVVSTQAIRYRDDGVAPTTTVGYPKPTSSEFAYSGNLSSVQFVAQTGTATLDVLFYK